MAGVIAGTLALVMVAGCASAGTTADEPRPDDGGPLLALADVAAQRVQLADIVAAAKWGTSASIDDPHRERVVLDSAAAKASRLALDPAVSTQVFTDQIEANKAVQYALYSRWSDHPDQAPRTRPDLGQVRPILDQITDRLLRQLKATQAVRTGLGCAAELATARQHAERTRALDPVHREALGRALASICRGATTG